MFPGCERIDAMPRKMSGSAISRIDPLIVAISMPSVVFDSATHLYSSLIPIPRVEADVNVNCSQRPAQV